MSSKIDNLIAAASNPKPINARIHRDIDSANMFPSSGINAGPGAAEAVFNKKAEDRDGAIQPSVGVSIQNDEISTFKQIMPNLFFKFAEEHFNIIYCILVSRS